MNKILFVLLLTIAFKSIGQTKTDSTFTIKNVGILLFDGVELLDFAGPGEVLQQAVFNGNKAFNVYTVGVNSKEVLSQEFLSISTQYTIDDCPLPDILVIPGGNTLSLVNNEKLISWIALANKKAEYILSVCNGVRLLAKTGAIDGMMATSHFMAIDNLTKEFPKVKMVKGKRFVDNGRIITTEGVSAGIDGTLYLLTKICNQETADAVARQIMYDWKPETLDVIIPDK